MMRIFILLVVVPATVWAVLMPDPTSDMLDRTGGISPADWPSNTPRFGSTGTIPTIPPTADLEVRKFAAANPAPLNVPLTYTLVITNHGTAVATGVLLADALPFNASFASATISQGRCSGLLIVVCSAGTISSGHTVTATIMVTPTGGISLTNVAYVTSFEIHDPDSSNNTATVVTQLGPAPAPGGWIYYLPIIAKQAAPLHICP